MGYSISSNFNVIILIASFQDNLNFKIQILAGNSLKICLGTCFEISTTLIVFQTNCLYNLLENLINFRETFTLCTYYRTLCTLEMHFSLDYPWIMPHKELIIFLFIYNFSCIICCSILLQTTIKFSDNENEMS